MLQTKVQDSSASDDCDAHAPGDENIGQRLVEPMQPPTSPPPYTDPIECTTDSSGPTEGEDIKLSEILAVGEKSNKFSAAEWSDDNDRA